MTPHYIYLIRHAAPDLTEPVPYETPPGPGLSAEGVKQARALGKFLSNKVRVVEYSPMQRTTETAALAFCARSASSSPFLCLLDDRLLECQPGEPLDRVTARMRAVFEEAVEGDMGIGLLTHGGPMVLLLTALGMSDADLIAHMARCDRGSPLPPAGVMRITVEDGRATAFELVFDPSKE